VNRPDAVDGYELPSERLNRAWSELFDEGFYREQAAGNATSSMSDAAEHYKRVGAFQGLDPSPWFITDHYLLGLAEAGLSIARRADWLTHYLTVGLAENINPTPLFDSSWYLMSNRDVALAIDMGVYATPLAHFASAGHLEGRRPSEAVRIDELLLRNPDISRAVQEGVEPSAVAAYVQRSRARHLASA
jgi:alkaline phosphatase D